MTFYIDICQCFLDIRFDVLRTINLLDYKIDSLKKRDSKKQRLITNFLKVRDQLYKTVWKLGPVRHFLNPTYSSLFDKEIIRKYMANETEPVTI